MQITKHEYPRQLVEMEGLSDGAQLPLEDIFLWNSRGDFPATTKENSLTVLVSFRNSEGTVSTVVGHNQDGDHTWRGQCAVGIVNPNDPKHSKFVTLLTPGTIPGNTFSVTQYGLVKAVNDLNPKILDRGVPRQVLARAVLDQPSLGPGCSFLTAPSSSEHPFGAGSYHYLFVEAFEKSKHFLYSGEMYSGQKISIVKPDLSDTTPTVLIHTNHFIHPELTEKRKVSQLISESSQIRKQRAEALIKKSLGEKSLTVDSVTEVIQSILSDQTLPFPLFHQTPEDGQCTLASAIFSVTCEETVRQENKEQRQIKEGKKKTKELPEHSVVESRSVVNWELSIDQPDGSVKKYAFRNAELTKKL